MGGGASGGGGQRRGPLSEAVDLLHRARERTLAAGTARIVLVVEHKLVVPPVPRRRRGGLLRPVGRAVLELAKRRFDFRHQEGEGVLDLRRRRSMVDFGSFASLYSDGQERAGRSGRALATLPPNPFGEPPALRLLDLLAGVTTAEDEGTEEVRGVPCRRLAARTDLSRASAATPGGLPAPPAERFEDLLGLPIGVWFDDAHIRRVHFADRHRNHTLELWDFGVDVDGLDWTRLPTFRSPAEAASVASRKSR